MTHWKRLWCFEGLGAGGEGDDRGWDGWMALLTWWTWVWVNSGSWWWTVRPGVLWFMGSQGVGHDWVTELNWTERTKMEKSSLSYLPRYILFLLLFLGSLCFRFLSGVISLLSKRCNLAIILLQIYWQKKKYFSYPLSENIFVSISLLNNTSTEYRFWVGDHFLSSFRKVMLFLSDHYSV